MNEDLELLFAELGQVSPDDFPHCLFHGATHGGCQFRTFPDIDCSDSGCRQGTAIFVLTNSITI